MPVCLLPCGPTAVMLEVETTEQAAQLAAHLRSMAITGIVDLIPAARTVLVCCDAPARLASVEAAVGSFVPGEETALNGVLVEVPTVYDGEDLASVADATSMSVQEVIELHSSITYQAAFCGFVPGFAYLTGLPPVLRLPRRLNPRARVPGGSVAIGADFTGVYPTASPGGWHLLGRATVAMWDSSRARPSFIEPGDTVRFVPVDG
jgi:KipI family sensor histidine kinase inhibitor